MESRWQQPQQQEHSPHAPRGTLPERNNLDIVYINMLTCYIFMPVNAIANRSAI